MSKVLHRYLPASTACGSPLACLGNGVLAVAGQDVDDQLEWLATSSATTWLNAT